MPPKLIVTVDVEEVFSWDTFDKNLIDVRETSELSRFQDLCVQHGLKPFYFITYPMLEQKALTNMLAGFFEKGECELGIHVHSWTTPPYQNSYDLVSSYQGNLPHEIEKAKIESICNLFREVFGFNTTNHRAGRFGCGRNTFKLIKDVGIDYDFSPSAKFDFSSKGGPNYADLAASPFIDQSSGTVCFPVSGEDFVTGPDRLTYFLDRIGLFPLARQTLGTQVVRLTTESNDANRLKLMTRLALNRSQETFVFTIHTTSLFEGGNQYSSTAEDVEHLFEETSKYFRFFTTELGGANGVPAEYDINGLPGIPFAEGL